MALLGPNGAGKSTTIKMLTGGLKPTSGNIFLDSKEYTELPFEAKSKIGIMPQEIIIWDDLNIQENLEYSAALYKLGRSTTQKRVKQLIDDLKLTPELKTLARNLSGGYKRRLNLAISIIHDPEIIFLDEPTPGIDAQSRILLTEYIQKIVIQEEKAVVLTDHYLEEAEKLTDYVIIIDDGAVITEGTVPELKAKHGDNNILQIHLDPLHNQNFAKIPDYFKDTFKDLTFSKDTIHIQVNDLESNITQAISIIKKHNLKTLHINIKQTTLEDIFLLLTGKEVRE